MSNGQGPNPGFILFGSISGLHGFSGAVVNFVGPESGVAGLTAFGTFIIQGLPSGIYIITPYCTGHTFTPPFMEVIVNKCPATFVGTFAAA